MASPPTVDFHQCPVRASLSVQSQSPDGPGSHAGASALTVPIIDARHDSESVCLSVGQTGSRGHDDTFCRLCVRRLLTGVFAIEHLYTSEQGD